MYGLLWLFEQGKLMGVDMVMKFMRHMVGNVEKFFKFTPLDDLR